MVKRLKELRAVLEYVHRQSIAVSYWNPMVVSKWTGGAFPAFIHCYKEVTGWRLNSRSVPVWIEKIIFDMTKRGNPLAERIVNTMNRREP